MTTAEKLALAVLKGDYVAIKMLVDHLQEDMQPNWEARQLVPAMNKITVPIDRVRVIVYVKDGDYDLDRNLLDQQIREWLTGQRVTLGLVGVDRVEIYELPENFISPFTTIPKMPIGRSITDEELRIQLDEDRQRNEARQIAFRRGQTESPGHIDDLEDIVTPEQFRAMMEDQPSRPTDE